MARHGRSADREAIGQLTHRPAAARELLHDRAAVGIAQRVEGIAGEGLQRDCIMVAKRLPLPVVKHYEASVAIDAPPETVWALLTDASRFGDWDSGIERVDGTITLGEKIKVHSEVSPGRAFPVEVTELARPERMVWAGGMPLGLFRGVRTFALSGADEGRTHFHMREEFTGYAGGVHRPAAAPHLALDARPRARVRAVRGRAQGARRGPLAPQPPTATSTI